MAKDTKAEPKAWADGVPVYCAHDAIVDITKLKPNPANPNKHPDSQIQILGRIIRETGWRAPITVSNRSGLIVKGHGRLQSALLEGFKSVPVDYQNYDSNESELADLVADNRIAELAEIDQKMLADIFAEIDTGEIPMELTGFTENEVEDLVTAMSESLHNEVKDPDDVPEAPEPENTVTELGDLWLIGNHRLMCGDSTDKETVEALMDGAKADMVFTDPPYGIGIDGQKESISKNPKHNRKAHEFMGWDNQRPDKKVFDFILSLNIPSVIFGGNYFADFLPASRGWIYWDKGQDGLTMSDGELAWTNLDKPLRRFLANRAQLQGSVHPTQKPVSVVSFCLNYVGDCEKVLDLFGGSGSTMIACEELGRSCYLMELEPKYCDVIVKRYIRVTGKKDVRLIRKGHEIDRAEYQRIFAE